MGEITDSELVNGVKSGDDLAMNELIRRHTPLCHKLYNKYRYVLEKKGISYNDVISEKDYKIYDAALSFSPDFKTKFSTWLGQQIKYQCLNTINKKTIITHINDIDPRELEQKINKKCISNYYENKQENINYLNSIINQITDKRVKKIIKIRFLSGDKKKSWSYVAGKMKLSPQATINIFNRAKKLIKNKMVSQSAIDKI
jgi:RNA polymerase sigma factor (sigma-70 family)